MANQIREHRHAVGGPAGEQAACEDSKRGGEREHRTPASRVVARRYRSDQAAKHEAAEAPGIERQAVQLAHRHRHDSGHGEAFKRDHDQH
jgi:hypothetical protein